MGYLETDGQQRQVWSFAITLGHGPDVSRGAERLRRLPKPRRR